MALDIVGEILNQANQQGVDPDFALKIAHTESGLNPNAVSPKGAKGVMQLMPDTAKGLGVDPNDPKQNIAGGVKYIKQLSDKYNGDPVLTAAAYNAGPGAVDKHGGVPPFPETQAYVQKVTGQTASLPHSDELDAIFGLPKGSGTTGQKPVSTPTSTMPSQADLDKAFGVNRDQPASKANQPQQTPGYKAAYNQLANQTEYGTPEQRLGAFGTTKLSNPVQLQNNTAQNAFENSYFNSFLMNTVPAMSGALTALTHMGKGNMGDWYAAGRDYQRQVMEAANQAHPTQALVGNVAGFTTSPATKLLALKAPAAVLKFAPAAVQASRAARLGASALGAAATGGVAATGQGISEGQSPGQIAKGAGISAAVSAPFGPLGELASGLGAAAKNPAVRTLAPAAAHSALGALGLGVPAYLATNNPKFAAEAAGVGAVQGLAGKVASIKEAQKAPPVIGDTDRLAAATHVANVVAKGNPEAAANHFENAPETHTALESLPQEQRQQMMQTLGEQHVANLGGLQDAVAARQAPEAVKGRLKGEIENASGTNPEDISDFVTKAPVEEANNIALKIEKAQGEANPAVLRENADQAIGQSVGIAPSEAEMGWQQHVDSMRAKNSKLWENVASTEPGLTPEHEQILAQEPVARQALAKAQNALGPEGSVEIPNPNYKPASENFRTPDNISDADIKEVLADKRGSDFRGENVPFPGKDQATADYLNNKHNLSSESNNEPETINVPTKKALVQAEREMRYNFIPRNFAGKVDYSNPRTFEIEQTQKALNEANKQHYAGLEEAKAASHEQKGGEEADEHGYNIANPTKNTESPEALKARYDKLNETQQAALKHGYLRGLHRDMQVSPENAAKKYSNGLHNSYQDVIFSPEEKATIQNEMQNIKDKVAAAKVKQETPVTDTIKKVQSLIKDENISDFNHAYESDVENQHLYKDVYTDHLNQTVNQIRNEEGNIEPKHLKQIEDLITSDFHKNVQDKLYGEEKAQQLRDAIRRELDLAKLGKEVTEFRPSATEGKPHLEATTSGIFGALSGRGSLHGMVRGALAGIGGAKIAESAPFIARTIKEGEMTPAARRAMGELLAKPPKQAAEEIRAATAQRRNMKMSKSVLKDTLAKRAALGVGLMAGTTAANAFNGVDMGQ